MLSASVCVEKENGNRVPMHRIQDDVRCCNRSDRVYVLRNRLASATAIFCVVFFFLMFVRSFRRSELLPDMQMFTFERERAQNYKNIKRYARIFRCSILCWCSIWQSMQKWCSNFFSQMDTHAHTEWDKYISDCEVLQRSWFFSFVGKTGT